MIVCLILEIISYLFLLAARHVSYKNKFLELLTIGMVIVAFCVVSGFRSNIGDTETYMFSYQALVSNPNIQFDRDLGFNALSRVLTHISANPQILILVTATIIAACNLTTLARYRKYAYYELQIYLYVTTGYFLTTMNGIRQALSAAVLFAFTNFVIKGKFIAYVIVVLILSTFHQSALIMIPAYFIVRQKPWSKRMFALMSIVILFVIAFDIFMPMVFSFLQNTQYGYYEEFFTDNNWGGSSLIRTVINYVPVILAFVMRREIKEKWEDSDIFVNMSVLNALVMTVSLKNWIFARFSYYFQPYNFVLIPLIISVMPKEKEKRFMYYLVLVCYLIFMLVEQNGLIYETNYLSLF